jgi:DNA-binding YbaB/EbfC family protein
LGLELHNANIQNPRPDPIPEENKEVASVQNFGNIMKQAKKMQERMLELQEELAVKTVEATAGGGMISVTVNGKFEILSLKIEKEVVNPDDVEMLQDLVIAAVNEGIRKAQEMAASEMGKLTGGMQIPGLM